jgi:hypothetical protein
MATLNSATDSVDAAMEEIRVLRCDLQRMTTAREDADAIIQGKERELQMVTMHLRRVEELPEETREQNPAGIGDTGQCQHAAGGTCN